MIYYFSWFCNLGWAPLGGSTWYLPGWNVQQTSSITLTVLQLEWLKQWGLAGLTCLSMWSLHQGSSFTR